MGTNYSNYISQQYTGSGVHRTMAGGTGSNAIVAPLIINQTSSAANGEMTINLAKKASGVNIARRPSASSKKNNSYGSNGRLSSARSSRNIDGNVTISSASQKQKKQTPRDSDNQVGASG